MCVTPVISRATAADDAALRRLMRDIDMGGAISVAFEREPSFFHAVAIEGDDHWVIVARQDQDLVGVVCLTRRRLFVNGMERPVYYLSSARVERSWRGRRVSPRALAALREIIGSQGDPLCFCTMAQDNAQAHAFLLGRHRQIPDFSCRERLCTLVVPTWRRRRAAADRIRAALPADMADIVRCLRRNGARRQFAVAWTDADLKSDARTRGLSVADFLVAEREGRISACVAVWDQRGFKQSVVTGYAGSLGTFRGAINRIAPLANLPRLPAPGGRLEHVYLSHLAVDEDDLDLSIELLDAAYATAKARGVGNVTFGLSERDPRLGKIARHFGGVRYWTELCTVGFASGNPVVLDQRPAHLEIATL